MASARAYFKGKIPETQLFRGQAELILNALKESVDEKSAKTTAAIAKQISPKLQTRQDPERVVAFYMSVWKKKGWVRAVDTTVPASEAAASNAADDAPQSVQDEVGGIHADTHTEARMEAEIETIHAPKLPDLTGRRLSEAVTEVFTFVGRAQTADEVLKVLNDNGYPFALNQVNSAIQNLVRKESLRKLEDGSYEQVVPANA